MSKQKSGGMLLAAGVPAGLVAVVLSMILLLGNDDAAAAACNPDPGAQSGVSIDPDSVPDTTIAGYGHEQLVNAAHVIQAGKDLSLGVRDQTIGVMTAMGESGLRVIDYGDAAGPDSRGLFQQRDNGAWGSYSDRMDPYISSTNFFKAMQQIDARDTLEPTIVAHRTQRNADPYHYAKYWDAAVQIVEELAGTDTGLVPGTGDQVCAGKGAGTIGKVNAEGWAQPAKGPLVSHYGMRVDPVTGAFTRLHAGADLAGGGDGGPIWAAQDGVVIDTFTDSYGGWNIDVDHGGGVVTRYKHMWASGVLVNTGDQVRAGEQIGRVGSSGNSTGPHLHFEVHVNGEPVDPEPFMAEVGITLGK
ncbi:M23 family metallopeptidase [Isoptericola sp. NPDC019482]|uniref:M23 family metallopeptidase n=1 Tax=Isoptericola sp. NPDC019482 TaxID=3154688 RepID=UPI003488B6D5